jgi:hypothetical protein
MTGIANGMQKSLTRCDRRTKDDCMHEPVFSNGAGGMREPVP